MNQTLAKQAIIIGGSIAGLSAARALSPYYEKVIIIERDENPDTYKPRKAAPQSHHVHLLLRRGEIALNALFPGLSDELLSCGAARIDSSQDIRWHHYGSWKLHYDSGLKIMVQSRPLLEQLIRERIKGLDNLEYYYGYQVKNLNLSADGHSIAGVNIEKMADRSEIISLNSDLLIDASGRGSKTPQWLQELGFSAAQETSIGIGLSYSTRSYRAPEGIEFDWRLLVQSPQAPHDTRGGYVFHLENNQWLVTLNGYSGEVTPKNNDAFSEYAKNLAEPDVYDAMQKLEPTGEVKSYSVPETIRRHYEKLQNMPQGLIVMGDASCTFDPVFGQGISVAAQEALALSEMLAKETPSSMATAGKRFHKKAATIVDIPWMLSSNEDFRYPATKGEKSPELPILHWYSKQIFELSAIDEEVFDAFAHVLHLLKGIETFFKPSIVWKVIKHAFSK